MKFFLKKSLLRRVFVYFALFSGLMLAVIAALYLQQLQGVPISVFAAILLLFIIYFLLVYYYEIVRPLIIVLEQIKRLLSGQKYSRIYTNRLDEIGVIAHFFNEITKSFEKVSYDIKEGKRMTTELEIASQIQKDILPPQNPTVPNLDVVVKTRPAAELGGDSFDFITKGDNTFIYIGDVTGHGVPAALVMTMVNTLIHTLVEVYDKAYDVVVNTNKQLKTRIKSTMFMTMVLLRWNHVNKTMSYVGSGHEHVLIYRAAQGKCEIWQTGGIALGMIADNSKLIEEKAIPMDTNDVIILYTDGVTEGRNMAGEMYGLARLVTDIERFAQQYGPDGIVNHVALAYTHFCEGHVQEDDVTLMALKPV